MALASENPARSLIQASKNLAFVAPDPAALIQAVAQGDRLAFRQLYDLTSPKLLGVILRMIRSRPAAEEVLQDVYLRVWRNASRYAPEMGSALGWLSSIARNRAIDILRQRTDVTMDPGEDGEDWFARVRDPRDRETEMMDNDSLRHCLGQIDAEKRSVLLLAYYEGLSREELATKFRQPVNTIKTWLHRSLASLKTCMEAQ